MSAMYSHDDLMRIAKDAGPFFADNARQALQWAARTLDAADKAVTAERARAELAEEELQQWRKLRDPVALHANLISGQPAALSRETFLHLAGADQLRARAESAEAERDRYRDALIACRPVVGMALSRFRELGAYKGVDQAAALLGEIEAAAAANGQGWG